MFEPGSAYFRTARGLKYKAGHGIIEPGSAKFREFRNARAFLGCYLGSTIGFNCDSFIGFSV